MVLPLLVCPPFPFFWAPRVPLILFLFYFGFVEMGNSRMLPMVFAPKFLSLGFLWASSRKPGFVSIFSASLSICIYPLSSRAFWSSNSLLPIYRVLFIWLAPFPNFSIVACLGTRTPNEDPVRLSMPTDDLHSFSGTQKNCRLP